MRNLTTAECSLFEAELLSIARMHYPARPLRALARPRCLAWPLHPHLQPTGDQTGNPLSSTFSSGLLLAAGVRGGLESGMASRQQRGHHPLLPSARMPLMANRNEPVRRKAKPRFLVGMPN